MTSVGTGNTFGNWKICLLLFGERWKNGGKGILNKVWGISIFKGRVRDSYTSDFQNWKRKKAFLLRLVDLIKENYETSKSEVHDIIEDKENGAGDENNSDDEDIMFFIDDEEEKGF